MSSSAIPSAPSPLRRLLQLTWEYRAGCVKVLALQGIVLALTLGSVSMTGLAIDVLRQRFDPEAPAPVWPLGLSPPSAWSAEQQLLVIGGLVLLMGLSLSALTYVHGVQSGQVQHLRLVPELRARVFHKLQRLSFAFFDQNGSGSLVNRVTGDVQATRSFVDGVFLQGAMLLLTLVVYAAFMLRSSAALTAACLAATPLIWLLTHRFSAWAQGAYKKTRELVDDMVLAMTEGVHGIVVTKVFGREREELARFERRNQAVVDQQQDIFRRASYFTSSVHFTSQLNLAVLLGYGGYLVYRRELSLGDLIVFRNVLSQFATQVSAMARVVNTLQQSLAGARRVFEVLDAPVEIQSPERAVDVSALRADAALRFERVSFGYQSGQDVLSEVSFDVPAGSCVAILGATGAGKTTLLNLVSRFYDVRSGRISLGGRDLRELDLDSLRRSVGVVFQNSLLFRQSVADNIAFGRPHATRAEIERAARISGADDFVRRLPRGYDTLLAEEGVDLSGGQRQRLALARAVLVDPRILVLDDPTSALDARTETEVLGAMRRVMQGRTTLMVASRLSTLRFADRVIVLDRGRIVEQGTHAELMAARGPYYQTALLQGLDMGAPAPTLAEQWA